MLFWLNISLVMIKTLTMALWHPFFWLVVFIVLMQYRRIVSMEKQLFGSPINNMWKQTLLSIFLGLLGGMFGSALLLLLGISLNSIGIFYLWPVAIFLFLLNPRFLCFAYAGGVIAAAALLVRGLLLFFPSLEQVWIVAGLLDIHLPSLLALVGILHLTEALLIFFSGHRGASPVYLKSPTGQIVGGYSMQRFWPLPLMGLWALVVADSSMMVVGGIPMPDWWPLLGTVMGTGGGETVVYMMVPLVAGLGYSDLALSSRPYEKKMKTAFNLALYSVVLSALAILSVFVPPVIVPAVLLAPLGHEYLIQKGNKEEFSRPPLFSLDNENGLKMLAVVPDSPAAIAGLQGGDRLLEINSSPVNSELEFWNLLRSNYHRAILKVKRGRYILDLPVVVYPRPVNEFGIIFVPGRWAGVYLELKQGSILNNIRRRFLPGGSRS